MSKKFDLLNINNVKQIVKSLLKYKKSGTVLDLGCGAGRHSLFLAKRGFKVVAVDNIFEVLAALKELARLQKLPIKVVRADVATYDPNKKFDVVLSNMVLHFISDNQKKRSLQSMWSATKKNGINVVSAYTDKNPKGTKPFPVKAGSLKKWYEKAGWKILYYYGGKSNPVSDFNNPAKTVRIWKEEIIAQKQN